MVSAVLDDPKDGPQIVHALPGRIRVRLPDWDGHGETWMERQVGQIPGVVEARASQYTRNVLVRFQPATIDQDALLDRLRQFQTPPSEAGYQADTMPLPQVQHERRGSLHRARIAVGGLDRDPHLARAVEARLESLPGAHARTSLLTGQAVVEWSANGNSNGSHNVAGLVSDADLPERRTFPGELPPAHPLDSGPLKQSLARLLGATLGLSFLAIRRMMGQTGPPTASAIPLALADGISILRSFPSTRNKLGRLLGHNTADTVFHTSYNASLAMAGLPLGLALNQAEGLRQFTEVMGRRVAWRGYEDSLAGQPSPRPDEVVQAEAGDRLPFAALVREGAGTTVGQDGMPLPLGPGSAVPPGAPLFGGPFLLELLSPEPFTPQPRPAHLDEPLLGRYLRVSGIASLGYALARGVMLRSPLQAVNSMLFVNPRVALVGSETADSGAAARVTRSGGVVVGSRPERSVRLPHVLIIDQPQLLTRGFECADVVPLSDRHTESHLLSLAKGISAATELPWGNVFAGSAAEFDEGRFECGTARARLNGAWYTLGPPQGDVSPEVREEFQGPGEYLLALRNEEEGQTLGLLALRPRIADGVPDVVQTCARSRVGVVLVAGGDSVAAQALANRLGVALAPGVNAIDLVRAYQSHKKIVAYVANHAGAAEAFDACDLALGLTGARGEFPARADILLPDFRGVGAVVEAGAERRKSVRDSTIISTVTNVLGAIGGFWLQSFARLSINITSVGALAAMGLGWWRMRGGKRTRSASAGLADPRPERWGRFSSAEALSTLGSREEGLTSAEAAERHRQAPTPPRRHLLLDAVLEQLRSPIIGIMGAGALLSLVAGNVLDVLVIGATIAFNVAVGVWQERQADKTVEALEQMGSPTARVLRDGATVTLNAEEVVPGDVLVLAAGDRVSADARLIRAQGLEVDESVLTGESLPVLKDADAASAHERVLLAGSDVTAGSGFAVVFAVGRQTRLGVTAAALEINEEQENPLAIRLSRLLRLALPVSIAAGVLVLVSGLLYGQPLWAQIAIGSSVAIAAIPEGIPLLSKISEAAVARRLAGRRALVRRLSAVEALGRVDVACVDKTGTLTEGKLALRTVCTVDEESDGPGNLSENLRQVLLTAALASPHPNGVVPITHPTDLAIVDGASQGGMDAEIQVERVAVSPFDPVRGFHAAVATGRLCVKGAPEVLVKFCQRVRVNGAEQELDDATRTQLIQQSEDLAARGLRVLMVAEGSKDTPVEDPQELVALGLVGISDPLRPTVRSAVERCRQAGIRVIMITGDHPKTALTIAQEAGLVDGYDYELITGQEIEDLSESELDDRLDKARVIARATPLDKVRIVESLSRRGHTVAMTGDGANDAPALRLADAGIAMGNGTEVAKQAADVVLADNDLSNLVEILVEGRSFWQRIRRALSLLVGGNLGELGLIAGLSLLGQPSPLTTRQILGVNMISDVLPALAIGLQGPEQRNLSSLAREGTATLEKPLGQEIIRRGLATALPAVAAYLLALPAGAPIARTVGFASIVATQLSQTLDMGWSRQGISWSVVGSVIVSALLLVASIIFGPLRNLLMLSPLPAMGWGLILAASLVAVLVNRTLSLLPTLGSRSENVVAQPA